MQLFVTLVALGASAVLAAGPPPALRGGTLSAPDAARAVAWQGSGPVPPASVEAWPALRPLRRPHAPEGAVALLDGFEDIQPKCDTLAGMVKDKNKAEESKCDSVILGGAASWGCKCMSIGEGQGGCAFVDGAYNPAKEVSDMGFTRVSTAAKFGDDKTGGIVTLTCMYYMYKNDVFQKDPDRTQDNLKRMQDETLGIIKGANDASYKVSKAVMYGTWILTPAPWPVDKYGTPMCFGFCTTLNIPYWHQWTQPPKKE